jgi:predicted TIM-barrel fold metal-dependent hydrolase
VLLWLREDDFPTFAMNLTRRQFIYALSGTALASTVTHGLATPSETLPAPTLTVIDFHVHLFGTGDGKTGCWLSEKQKHHLNYHYFLRLLGLKNNGHMDEDYVQSLVTQLKASSVQKAVLQAWDCRYDEKGEPDWERTTSVFVPNDYMLKVVQRYPELFIPCASINPKRKDAIQELERCAKQGVRVVKIHPPAMDVDPATPAFREFYRRCAANKIIVMVHTGAEHAADIVGLEYCDPQRLTLALEAGGKVIAAHAGMSTFFDKNDFFPSLRALIRQFPNFYIDTSVLASTFRWRNLPRILEDGEIMQRAIHGSDFPFPSNALVFWNRIAPSKMAALLEEKNLLERDYRLKRALGLPREVFERGANLLAEATHP